MNNKAVYDALRDYVELALRSIDSNGVSAENALFIEGAEATHGEEWTGIRMSKLPMAQTHRTFISGDKEVAVGFQLISKQSSSASISDNKAIAYSTYLEGLTGKLESMFKARVLPTLPDNCTLRRVEPVQQSTLTFSNGKYSGYVLDIRFIIRVRR